MFPIKRHWNYLKYVLRHKWFVMQECFRMGLIWRGLVHDIDKFLPDEWFSYAKFFYNSDGTKKIKIRKFGYYKPTDTGNKKFDYAWLLHQKRNKHHWQWWILPEDEGGLKILEMPIIYIREMICDWIGAGRAQNVENWRDVVPWYSLNKDKMQLHPTTRLILEIMIGYYKNKTERL